MQRNMNSSRKKERKKERKKGSNAKKYEFK